MGNMTKNDNNQDLEIWIPTDQVGFIREDAWVVSRWGNAWDYQLQNSSLKETDSSGEDFRPTTSVPENMLSALWARLPLLLGVEVTKSKVRRERMSYSAC